VRGLRVTVPRRGLDGEPQQRGLARVQGEGLTDARVEYSVIVQKR
jgi:hypothetical protein